MIAMIEGRDFRAIAQKLIKPDLSGQNMNEVRPVHSMAPHNDELSNTRRHVLVESDDSVHHGVGYLDFLEFLSKQLNPLSYLEIGSRTGDSVNRIDCDAICIDPAFRVRGNVLKTRSMMFFFQMTSDRFFAEHDVRLFFPNGIDLAFLDGLHRFEFLLRDFINTEKHCHKNSIILLHDCLPYKVGISSRTELNDDWSGDVWKVLPIFRKYRPDLKVTMFDCPPTGLIACTNLNSESLALEDAFSQIVEESFRTPDEPENLHSLRGLYPLLDTRQLLGTPEDLSAVLPFAYKPRRNPLPHK